ncbi:hypothetical protein AMECASPLE_030216, partial [Ameca splendens]
SAKPGNTLKQCDVTSMQNNQMSCIPQLNSSSCFLDKVCWCLKVFRSHSFSRPTILNSEPE